MAKKLSALSVGSVSAARVAVVLASMYAAGCSRQPPEATPEGALRSLLEHIEQADGDPAKTRDVYERLAASTRANLDERARRASVASGRLVLPEEMIAPSRFALRFEPRQMRSHINGEQAIVDVVGIDPTTDHAEVPCVLEHGTWHIVINLPALFPIERRQDAGT